jgi:hypothetical protein
MHDLQILAKWSENQTDIQLTDYLITAKSFGRVKNFKGVFPPRL